MMTRSQIKGINTSAFAMEVLSRSGVSRQASIDDEEQ